MKHHKKTARLIVKFRQNDLNDRERRALNKWINRSNRNREMFERLSKETLKPRMSTSEKEAAWQKVISYKPKDEAPIVPARNYRPYIAAACLIAIITTAAVLYYIGRAGHDAIGQFPDTVSAEDAPDATFLSANMRSSLSLKPLLFLPDGSIIELNSHARGLLGHIGYKAIYGSEKQVVFDFTTSGRSSFNDPGWLSMRSCMIRASKDSICVIRLYDGSEITLNKGSVLQFPSAFTGERRLVRLSGEGYFKVRPQYDQHGANVPFIVKVNSMEVKVLGTEFDIKAYSNEESVKTTLVEGLVEVTNDTAKRRLEPGQEITLNTKGEFTDPQMADVDGIVAWKNSIALVDASIEKIMEKICRKYDLKAVYKIHLPNRYRIYIPSEATCTEALGIVKMICDVKFELIGKNVIVTK